MRTPPRPTAPPTRTAIAALAAAACAAGPANEPAGTGAGAPAAATGEARSSQGPLTATLRVAPAEVAGGDSIRVRFALVNATAAPVRVVLSCTAPAYLALLPAAGGEPIDGTGCGQAITDRTLAAGGEETMTVTWRAVRPGTATPLAPGRYSVEAKPTVLEADGRSLTLGTLRTDVVVR